MICWEFREGGWVGCVGIPPEDRGFRYGMSFFETVGVVDGRPIFWREHLARLQAAAGAMEVPIPKCPGTGLLRIYVTAGPGGVGAAFCGGVYALFEECEVGVGFSSLRVGCSAAPYLPRPGGWKTGNYWQNVDALADAVRRGWDDALLFNPAGSLVCASMGNVFLKVGGRWRTPSLATGAREGVVREWVLREMDVEEGLLGAEDVATSSEGFVANSRVGLRAIRELDGRALTTDIGHLVERYRAYVG